jgi:hypothetical protein
MPVSFFTESEERLKWHKVIYIIRCWYINITYILIYNNIVCIYIYIYVYICIYMLINEKVKGSFPYSSPVFGGRSHREVFFFEWIHIYKLLYLIWQIGFTFIIWIEKIQTTYKHIYFLCLCVLLRKEHGASHMQ